MTEPDPYYISITPRSVSSDHCGELIVMSARLYRYLPVASHLHLHCGRQLGVNIGTKQREAK